MVNTRTNNSAPSANPPPPTMEDLMRMQTQLMQQMAQTMAAMQQNQQHPQQYPAPPRDKRGEFMKGHPPRFCRQPSGSR